MTIKEYTHEFYRLNISTGHIEEDAQKVARYINGLKYELQDEINLLSLITVEDAYQTNLKEKEKLTKPEPKKQRKESSKRQRTI